MQYRVLEYFEGSGEDITYYLKECQNRAYLYDTMWLPHDAKAKRMGSHRSIEEIVRAAGYKVRLVPKLSLVDGINAARIVFPNCWFDEVKCEDGLHRLRHYRYKVVEGQFSNEPMHDENSDGADAFRYMAISIKGPVMKGSDVLRRLELAGKKAREENGEWEKPNHYQGQSWMG